MYYGPDKIKVQEGNIDETVITLENGTEILLNPRMAQWVITEKPQDLTSLRDARIDPVKHEIIQSIREWNLKLSEVEFLFSSVILSINELVKRANHKAWGTPELERTLRDADKLVE
jgi:hypothetical protein